MRPPRGMRQREAHVDDTIIVGDAQDVRWIQQVAKCYADVRFSGFMVDFHSCYRGVTNSVMKFGPSNLAVHNYFESCYYYCLDLLKRLPLQHSRRP